MSGLAPVVTMAKQLKVSPVSLSVKGFQMPAIKKYLDLLSAIQYGYFISFFARPV
jgi:hypothetical protein